MGRRALWLGTGLLFVVAHAPPAPAAQIAGTFRTAPGTKATFYFGSDSMSGITVPADITATFSGDNPTTMVTATIHQPIIGVDGDGAAVTPIGSMFPLTVRGTSTDGVTFRGELIAGTQFGFEWQFNAVRSDLVLNGSVAWLGGRIEHTEIMSALLTPVPEPGSVVLLLVGAAAALVCRLRSLH
jgi:hypothetical protein